jgi:hypothetical protein
MKINQKLLNLQIVETENGAKNDKKGALQKRSRLV